VPQALVQAMLASLPCVTTSVGGIPEIAIHEKTALVVPAEDSPALKNALERVLANPALARRLGDEARRHCAANFSYQGMLEKMERIYFQVLR
jgi:glycosyltransferase involved in cell wall biosynthesis